jgi:hypothetical protein
VDAERRELDFLTAMYTKEKAMIFPAIHRLDRPAFRKWVHGYNMRTFTFEGSMLEIDALMSDEPHLRGVGARVQLHGLTSASHNGLEGRILFEDRVSKRIAIQLDDGRPPIKVRLHNLKYYHSKSGYAQQAADPSSYDDDCSLS